MELKKKHVFGVERDIERNCTDMILNEGQRGRKQHRQRNIDSNAHKYKRHMSPEIYSDFGLPLTDST